MPEERDDDAMRYRRARRLLHFQAGQAHFYGAENTFTVTQ